MSARQDQRKEAARNGGQAADDPDDCLGFCSKERAADLGDLVVVLLASTLAGLRDRLVADGFDRAGELVCDLVELADDYLSRRCA